MPRISNNKRGFTIIEVVLVLAIAGLIFLMVFIALPALQRSQRDTQRNNDISRFMTAVTQFQSNNRGKVPGTTASGGNGTTWANFITNYLKAGGDTFEDPDGTAYTAEEKGKLSGTYSAPTSTFDHKLYIYAKATCDGENAKASNGDRQIAVIFKREGGGYICRNN